MAKSKQTVLLTRPEAVSYNVHSLLATGPTSQADLLSGTLEIPVPMSVLLQQEIIVHNNANYNCLTLNSVCDHSSL